MKFLLKLLVNETPKSAALAGAASFEPSCVISRLAVRARREIAEKQMNNFLRWADSCVGARRFARLRLSLTHS